MNFSLVAASGVSVVAVLGLLIVLMSLDIDDLINKADRERDMYVDNRCLHTASITVQHMILQKLSILKILWQLCAFNLKTNP